MHKNYSVLIPAKYDSGDRCFGKNKLAWVEKNGKFGYINYKDEIVIPFIYEDAAHFSFGLAGVKKNGKWGVINSKGGIIAPFEYDGIGEFTDYYTEDLKGIICTQVRKGDIYYYIGGDGKIIRPVKK
ncbi:MAG: WG repeat-containing protein [Saprospiraceae bacterium]|nr:WG repeat-containing protein [Saprospiraceae bacterium]